MNISRRRFLQCAAGGLALGAVGVLQSEINESADFKFYTHKVEIPGLPNSFKNYRIGFLTDIHLGRYLPTEVLDDACSKISQARVDLLLLGGDYIWLPDPSAIDSIYPIRNSEFAENLGKVSSDEIFKRIADITSANRPIDGICAVLGNHDNWVDPLGCIKIFQNQDILVLENSTTRVARGNASLKIIGVKDYWTGVPVLPKAEELKTPNQVNILLCHNPDFISEILKKGNPGISMAIAGHTHGGQLRYPVIGAPYYNIDDLRFAEGFYRQNNFISYTSRGLGVVEVPFRLNCPAEITVFELV